MKKLMLQLLLATLAIVALYTVQVDATDIDKSRVIVLPTVNPPIVIDRCIYCFLHPTATGCNPCKYGSPILSVPCGQGSRRCEALGGTCKYNQCDRAYCCRYEHRGCCPPVLYTPIVIGKPTFCLPRCKTDRDCSISQKCCGSCPRCVNAVYT
ncbi:unnamed protein product [Rotaria sp. Silwood1]|nr:unnamed protein product [Rotaria sp. Silwood1]CAF4878061.1 unnamed protein product [Rotaria sp. Silwood1]